ncbi:MAG: hypothetical protein ACOX2K_05095 [Bacillota bacterium]
MTRQRRHKAISKLISWVLLVLMLFGHMEGAIRPAFAAPASVPAPLEAASQGHHYPGEQNVENPTETGGESLEEPEGEPDAGIGEPEQTPQPGSGEDPGQGSGEVPAGDPGQSADEEPIGESGQDAEGDPTEVPGQDPEEESTGDPEQDADGDPAEEPGSGSEEDPTEASGRDSEGDPTGETGQDSEMDPTEEPEQAPPEEPGEIPEGGPEQDPEDAPEDEPGQNPEPASEGDPDGFDPNLAENPAPETAEGDPTGSSAMATESVGWLDLTITANVDNDALVLTWETPPGYDFADIYRSADGEEKLDYYVWTSEDSYTDWDVLPRETYVYRVELYDYLGRFLGETVTATGNLNPLSASLYLQLGGVATSESVDCFPAEAFFASEQEILDIEYSYSSDGEEWLPLESQDDEGVQYHPQVLLWSRAVELDLSSLPDGDYYIRAIATVADGASLSIEKALLVKTVAGNASNLTAAPNAENTALVLTWDTPPDFYEADIFRWDPDREQWLLRDWTAGNTWTDRNVYPGEVYTYKVVVYDQYWNESLEAPTVEGALEERPIYLYEWYLYKGWVASSPTIDWFPVLASFLAQGSLTAIDYALSADRDVWHPVEGEMLVHDYGLAYDEGRQCVYREIVLDLSSLADGIYYLRATATDADDNVLAVETEIRVKTVGDDVINLTVAPNAENDALVLTWERPQDFDYAQVYRWEEGGYYYAAAEDEGGSMDEPGDQSAAASGEGLEAGQTSEDGYWNCLDSYAWGNTYTDHYVMPYQSYTYKVVAVDIYDNVSADPPIVTGELVSDPLMFDQLYLSNDGVASANNLEWFYVEASFFAKEELMAIDYCYSADQVDWLSVDPLISWDYELYGYDHSWNRGVELDLSGFADGVYYLRATATDVDGLTLSVERQFKVKTVADNVTNLAVAPNDDNDALLLTWENPADFSRAEVYRWTHDSSDPSEKWTHVWTLYRWSDPNCEYLDTDVYPYKTYSYRVRIVDGYGNISVDEPTVSGELTSEGELAFLNWDLSDDQVIASDDVGSFYIGAYFSARHQMSEIEFSFSSDNENFQSLEPLLNYDNGFYWIAYRNRGYRTARFNLTSLPEGDLWLRAVGRDQLGNELAVTKQIYKDTVPPGLVTEFTVQVNDDLSGFVLSWVNPEDEDFDHAVVQGRLSSSSYWSTLGNVQDGTYTDFDVTPGLQYEYQIRTVDIWGNHSPASESRLVTIPVDAPVLVSLKPSDGTETSHTNIYYAAEFIDDHEITSIVVEVSLDGETWQPLNANATPSRSNNRFTVSGYWDLTPIGEGLYQVRARAVDVAGRSTTSQLHWVTVDRLPPAIPANFTAENVANGIRLAWDPIPDAERYTLTRQVPSGDGWSYSGQWTVYPPDCSLVDTSAARDTVYRYALYARDAMGNTGDTAYVIGEHFVGPALELEGGVHVPTNQAAYTLRGQTVAGATVVVNGQSVAVNPDGTFAQVVNLVSGSNAITAIASLGGQSHAKKQTVLLDSAAPSISSFSPGENARIGGSRVSIYVSVSDSGNSGVDYVDLEMTPDNEATWLRIGRWERDDLDHYSNGAYGYYYWDSTAAIADYGQLVDGSYKFRAIAYDRAGNASNGLPVRVWTVDNTPPAAPVNVQATGTADQITVTWGSSGESDLASSPYRVYRSTSPGSAYQQVYSGGATQYVDTAVEAGVNYYYVVTARDTVGNESAYSQEVVAAAVADSTSPTITYTSVTEGNTYGGPQFNLEFRATDDSPKPISLFTFEYSSDGGETWSLIASDVPSYYSYGGYYYLSRPWVTEGLTSGSYRLKFSAQDAAGNVSSLERNIILDVFASTPANFAAITGEGTVTLTWEPVPDADFNRYEIWRAESADGSYTRVGSSITQRATASFVDNTGTIGATYYYKIRHYDTRGNLGESAAIPGTFLDDSTPPVVTEIGNPSPLYNGATGGPTIRFYARATDNKEVSALAAEYSADGGETWIDAGIGGEGLSKTTNYYYQYFNWDTAGLSSGTYLVRATATDGAGNTASLVADPGWTVDLSASTVTGLTATPGDGQVVLAWEPVADPDFYYYYVYRASDPEGPYSNIRSISSKTTTTYTDTTLAAETTYYYQIEHRDRVNNRSRTEPIAVTTLADQTPPTISSVSPSSGGRIGGTSSSFSFNVYYSDNCGPTGATGTMYYSQNGGEESSRSMVFYTNRFLGTLQAEDLVDGTLDVRFVIRDQAGNAAEREATYTVDFTPPAPPQNLIATYGAGEIALAWEAPPDLDVSSYQIYRANSAAGPYTSLTTRSGRNNVTYVDKTVVSGLTYYYKVTAKDSLNLISADSNIASAAAVSDTMPPEVTAMTPVSGTAFAKSASITAFATDNLALQSIRLEYRQAGGDWIAIATRATPDQTTFIWDTSALSGEVEVRAIARDSHGNESEPLVRTYRIDNTAPPAPQGVVAVAEILSVTVSWEPVEGDDLHQYRVYWGEHPDSLVACATVNAATLSYTKTDMAPGVEAYFAVSALDQLQNESQLSEVVSAEPIFDTAPPEMLSLLPAEGARLNGLVRLTATASDDLAVERVFFSYASEGSEEWEALAEVGTFGQGDAYVGTYFWNTAGLSGNYTIKAEAVDKGGNSDFLTTSIVLDNTPPPVPEGVTATALSGAVNLGWTAVVAPDVTRYRVYKRTEGGNWNQVITVNANTFAHVDGNVVVGSTYYYAVAALDDLNNESAKSAEVQVTVSPFAPTLTVTPHVAAPEALLTFQGDGFKPGEWVDLTMDDGRQLKHFFADSEGKILTTWLFAVNVFPGEHVFTATGRTSKASAQTTLTALFDLPAAPMVESQTAVVEANLSWTAVAGKTAYYRVYRAVEDSGSFGDYSLLADRIKASALAYTDQAVSARLRYRYRVAAVDIYGNEGAWSEPVEVIPLPDMTPPILSAFTTSRTGDVLTLQVNACDDIGVTSVSFAYYQDDAFVELPAVSVNSGRGEEITVSYDFDTSLLPDGYYDLRVRAVDAEGNSSQPLTTIVYVRSSPPEAPSEVSATPGQMRIDVSWSVVVDDELQSYRLYRQAGEGEWILLQTARLLSYSDLDVEAGVGYTYKVTAVDTYGHESEGTLSSVAVALNDTTPPEVSDLLPAEGSRIRSIAKISALAWDNVGVSAVDFAYSSDGEEWSDLALATTGTVSWDTTGIPDGLYYIRAIATDAAGNQAEREGSYTVDNTPPPPPAVMGSPAELKVTLTWLPEGQAEDFDHYRVYRAAAVEGTFELLGETTATVYSDLTMPQGVPSFYVVEAWDQAGNSSARSNVVEVTPGQDVTPPLVAVFEPSAGTPLRSAVTLVAQATDNVAVAQYAFYYRPLADDPDADWILLGAVDQPMEEAQLTWDTLATGSEDAFLYPDGNYQVKVEAVDTTGNVSLRIQDYSVTNNPPLPPSDLRVDAAEWKLVVSWMPVQRADVDYYRVYRSVDSSHGPWELAIDQVTANVYVDTMCDPEMTYYYRVSVVNDLGRESDLSPAISGRSRHETSTPIILSLNPGI